MSAQEGAPGRGQDRPTVSVIVPSRDRHDLVRTAVQSVLDQGIPVDIIVIDDGSDPPLTPTGPLGDEQVRIIRNEAALGPTKARNVGLRASTGDYVAFLDDDDTWLPGKLLHSLAAVAAFPEARVAVHRTAFEPPASIKEAPATKLVSEPHTGYGTAQTPHINGVLVDGDLARAVLFDESFDAAQDVDFMLELARQTSFAVIDAVLAVHGDYGAPTLVGLDRRIAARMKLRSKHADILYSTRRSRSFYHVRLAHLYRRRGSRARALRGFLTALIHDPSSGAAWRGLGAAIMPDSWVRAGSLQRRAEREA